jgi:hypothetical protein
LFFESLNAINSQAASLTPLYPTRSL